MNLFDDFKRLETRRQFFTRGKNVLGYAALTSLLGGQSGALAAAVANGSGAKPAGANPLGLPHFAPKAKRVIYLHMVGGPSQMDLWDPKPQMDAWYDKDLPESVRQGQRLTTMTSGQSRFPIAPSKFKFSRAGRSGVLMNTDLLPYTAKVVDDLCLIR